MDPNQDASYHRLLKIEWCAKLLNDKAWRLALNKTSTQPAENGNRFFGQTLRTEDTIRSSICLYKVREGQVTETLVFSELGGGVTGLPGMIHGGMTAALLDEASGIFVAALVGPDVPLLLDAWENDGCGALAPTTTTATIYLNVTYLKYVKDESVVVIRSRLKERKGRKLFVESQVEDADGNVLVKADALFIETRKSTL